jgi:hypothetical protein
MCRGCEIVGRVERERVRVILDVDREGVPIRGTLSIAPGVQRRFHGWLELADALEAARAGVLSPASVSTGLDAAERPAAVRIG